MQKKKKKKKKKEEEKIELLTVGPIHVTAHHHCRLKIVDCEATGAPHGTTTGRVTAILRINLLVTL